MINPVKYDGGDEGNVDHVDLAADVSYDLDYAAMDSISDVDAAWHAAEMLPVGADGWLTDVVPPSVASQLAAEERARLWLELLPDVDARNFFVPTATTAPKMVW